MYIGQCVNLNRYTYSIHRHCHPTDSIHTYLCVVGALQSRGHLDDILILIFFFLFLSSLSPSTSSSTSSSWLLLVVVVVVVAAAGLLDAFGFLLLDQVESRCCWQS